VAALGPWLPRRRQWAPVQAFLKGVNVALVGRILVGSASLLGAAIVDVPTALLLVLALAALLRLRVDTVWLVLGGALAGRLHYLLLR